MKTLLILSTFSALALVSCDTPKSAEEAAKRQRYEAIGDKLLKLGTRVGYLTPDEASEIREIGVLVVPTEAPTVDAKSGK